MFGKHFALNEETLPVVEEIGRHMPGGFFIYKAQEPEELLYANKAVFDIFGCADAGEFRALTGNTFGGMLHPDDSRDVHEAIDEQRTNTALEPWERISAAIGYASREPGGDDASATFQRADERMYERKKQMKEQSGGRPR